MTSETPAVTAAGGTPKPKSVRLTNVAKRFGATVALEGVSCELAPGRVYALVGENGSGKSTLIKALGGVVVPDSGEIAIGSEVMTSHNPRASLARGVSVVYQELLLAPWSSVFENLYMWDGGWLRSSTSRAEREARAEEALRVLTPKPPALRAVVGELDLGTQQIIAIARTLLRPDDACVVFDEATSALDRESAQRLLEVSRTLASANKVVIFVSHRMDEVMSVSDAALVLRNGRLVGELGDSREITPQSLLTMMGGSGDGSRERRARPHTHAHRTTGDVVDAGSGLDGPHGRRDAKTFTLSVEKLRLLPHTPEIDASFEGGTVVGLAGLEGHGQSELLKYLAGITKPRAGRVVLCHGTSETEIRTQRGAVRQGVVYVPRDRKTEGILAGQTILDNFALPTWHSKLSTAGLVRPKRARALYQDFSARLGIRASKPTAPIDSLSGGNQQKVILARWLAAAPQAVILDDPTRGVDHPTKLDLYRAFRRLAAEGVLVILTSSEIAELTALCERVIVLRTHMPVADFAGSDITEPNILAAMFGEHRDGVEARAEPEGEALR
jgi:ABC-type sugar transport system ATPase subunit